MSYTINNYRANGVVLNLGTQNPTTVTSSGTITNQFYAGDVLYGSTAAAWNITNYGVISTGTATSGNAVHLLAGGTLSNAAGTISGYANGILIGGSGGTITNSATIAGTGTTSDGVNLAAGGTVYNAATAPISGQQFGVYIGGTAGTVDNQGMIDGTGLFGVEFQAGGAVSNASTGVILGGASGVVIYNAPGTVTNYGAISGAGSFGNGVHVSSGGLVANQSSSALITGYRGVYIYGGNGTVTNTGTIDGAETGVRLSAGTLSNSGVIIGVGKGVAFGSLDSVSPYVPSFSNTGTISATGTNGIGVNGYRYTGGGALTVTNYGTIAATASGGTGVVLSDGGGVSNAAGSALIAGDVSGVLINGATGTLSNLGTIEGAGTSGVGVDLAAGGTVVNAGTIIGGNGTAIYLGGPGNNLLDLAPLYALTGNVVTTGTANALELSVGGGGSGTISGLGLKFQNFTTVTVDAGANWVLAGNNAVGPGVTLSDLGTLTNTGSLTGTGSLVVDPASLVNSGYIGLTVTLSGGGYLDNTATGTITTAADAVYGTLAPPTIVNAGTIEAIGPASAGVYLRAGGSVTNAVGTALISGYVSGVHVYGTVGTVSNFGTIEGTGTNGDGVYLHTGGSVTNALTAAVIGGVHDGVRIISAGTVNNLGTIEGTGTISHAVYLVTGGLVTNGASGASSGGVIAGYYGVVIDTGAGTVSNYGTIVGQSGYGVFLISNTGGYVANAVGGVILGAKGGVESRFGSGPETVRNSGAIESTALGYGVRLGGAGGNVTNAGTGALIAGSRGGVIIAGSAGVVSNYGTIVDTGALGSGVELRTGGDVTNAVSTALIAGYANGVFVSGAAGTVGNLGTIESTAALGYGVNLRAGGLVTNQSTGGLIAGSFSGVLIYGGTSTVSNLGTIEGTGTNGIGAYLLSGGNVTNASTAAVISGISEGVRIRSTGTVSNLGTIDGIGTAGIGVFLAAGGTVVNAGTISGAGGTAVALGGGSALVVVEPGAVFDGAIAGFNATDTIDMAAVVATNDRYAGGVLTLVNSGTVTATLGVTTPVVNPVFLLGTDGSGGSLVSVTSGTAYTSGIVLSNPTTQNPTTITAAVYVTNTTAAFSGDAVYGTNAAAWNFSNYGTLNATGTASDGVQFVAGGTILNAASGMIAGAAQGIAIAGGAGTVSNLGTISGAGPAGVGINLLAGGYVTNGASVGASALIAGYDGVRLSGPSGTLVNFGTIESTGAAFGAQALDFLSGGTVTNNGTIVGRNSDASGINAGFAPDLIINGTGALIAGWLNGIDQFSGIGTIVNSGAVESSNGTGVYLQAGGRADNAVATAQIAGYVNGVYIGGSSGTVSNLGAITGTGGVGVRLGAGGYVANSSGSTIDGDANGIFVAGGVGTVVNSGAIAATDTATGAGIALHLGGYVSNAAGGAISGYNNGVFVTGAAATVANSAMIEATGAQASAVLLNNASGSVSNAASGLISGADVAVNFAGAGAGTVSNLGAIEALGSIVNLSGSIVAGNAIFLGAGGIVNNGTTGLIEGYHIGVLAGATGIATVVNSGTIESLQTAVNGFPGAGIQLSGGGSVDNTGLIEAAAGQGVVVGSAAGGIGTITNFGAILTTGTSLSPTGDHMNPVALLGGGTIVNGSPILTSALIQGYERAIYAGGQNSQPRPGAVTTLVNYGMITATGTGTVTAVAVELVAGGVVTNRGVISSTAKTALGIGTTSFASVGIVENFGAITSTGTTAGVAVYLASGGTVTNEFGGVVSAYRTAVSLKNSAGSVSNYGRVASAGTYYSGVYLGAGGGVTNQAGGTIVSGWNGVDAKNVSATVSNLGMIASTATALSPLGFHGAGVLLQQGGLVVNGAGTATISGYEFGVYIGGAKGVPNPGAGGTIVNHGTIYSTGTGTVARAAAELTAGGTINNYGSITSAGSNAIHIGGTVAGTVDNFGLIENFAAHAAIYSAAGGVVTNIAGATITSTLTAISFKDTAGTTVSFGTVINAARIVSYATGGSGAGVYFGQGGTLTNQTTGMITAYRSGVSAKSSAAAVTNAGYILSTGNNYAGVYLGAGGAVTNSGSIASLGSVGVGVGVRLAAGGYVANSGQITGQYDAVRVTGGAGTIDNLGIIDGNGTFTDGVAMFAGGSVTNGALGAATALIEGNGRRGVFVYGGLGTVTNFATIVSIANLSNTYVGVYLKGGGSVTNEIDGIIQGAPGIAGVAIGHLGGTVANYGSITGVFLGAGGTVTNQYGGVIAVTSTAINVLTNAGTIVNYGSIVATGSGGSGVFLAAGGAVTNGAGTLNTAAIRGESFGVTIAASGDVTNYGTIAAASGVGVGFTAGSSTLTNAGTVTGGGGTAISFAGAGNRLIVDPGAVFGGSVYGGSAGGVLELAAGNGNIGGIGTSFTGFAQVAVDLPGTWLLAGTNTIGSLVDSGVLSIGGGAALAIANGASGAGSIDFAAPLGALAIDGTTMPSLPIVGFAQGDSIDLPNVAATAITYAGGVLTLSNGTTQVAQLNVATPYANPGFTAMRDATGGTLITVSPPSPADYTFVTNFAQNNLIQTALIKEFPSGITTGNQGLAVPFDITPDASGDNFYQITSSLTINVSIPSVTNIFTLLNAYRPPPGVTGATIEFIGSLGADQVFNLVYGSDVRDFFQDSFANTINGTTTQNAFTVSGVQDGGGTGNVNTGLVGTYNIDEQDFALAPAFALQTLQQIVITNVDAGATPILLGLTALQTTPVAPTISGPSDTNIVQPAIAGQGLAGDTVRLFINGTAANSGTVTSGGTWSIQAPSPLADGVYNLTATQTDVFNNVSPISATAALRIDTTPPVTAPASLSVLAGSPAVPIGIAAPIDPDDAAAALTVTVTALPSDGTVTLADGTTPVTLGVLTGGVPALTGLDFIAGAGSIGSFRYTVADPAGTATAGTATLTVTGGTAHQFDFIFTYSDGKDYYFGTVADDGRFAYRAGQTIVATSGTYDIYNKETQSTSDAPGTVRVTSYSHSGPGLVSPTPIETAAGQRDGSGGLTSESDAVLGTDGQPHPFSSASEASFPTAALFGFVFTYADGVAFYSGTVADNGSFGTTPGSRTVTDSPGNVLGSYTIFAEGTTALPAGSVVVDRFTEGGISYIPNGGGGAGGAGLGSEAGSVTANGTSFGFNDHQEPAIPSAIVPLAITPAPSTADIVTAELTDIYQEVLNRNPDAGGLATYTAAIGAGTSLDSIRTTIAQSPEAQNDLNQLYLQIFERNGDPGGLATYTAELIGGASLGTIELLLAQSPEAQSDLNQVYQNVLARDADGGGLTTYMAALGQGTGLGQIRSQIAHSPEAHDDLIQLFQQVTGQAPGAAQLAGMEDQIAQPGASQQTVAASLGSTTGLAVITAGLGDASLTAQPLTPTLFVFNDIAFGHDTIAGFDATRDTIELARTLAPDFATVQSELSSTAAGALLTLNQNQSILLGGVAPASLGATNFQFA